MNNDAWIYGSKGKIHVPEFLAARSATLHATGSEPVTFTDDRQARGYAFQAIEAMACLRDGRTESAAITQDETVRIMETLDAVRAQWGLKYAGE